LPANFAQLKLFTAKMTPFIVCASGSALWRDIREGDGSTSPCDAEIAEIVDTTPAHRAPRDAALNAAAPRGMI